MCKWVLDGKPTQTDSNHQAHFFSLPNGKIQSIWMLHTQLDSRQKGAAAVILVGNSGTAKDPTFRTGNGGKGVKLKEIQDDSRAL